MRVLPMRRRAEGKTDYQNRMNLLKSGRTRVVFRKTGRYIIGQIIESKEAQDKILISMSSKDLIESGWPEKWAGSLKSMPASYLTGFLLGNKAIKAGQKDMILDLGLNRNVSKSRIYAFVKGLKDSGVSIPCKEEMLPSKERIEGMHMKKDIKSVMDKVKGK